MAKKREPRPKGDHPRSQHQTATGLPI